MRLIAIILLSLTGFIAAADPPDSSATAIDALSRLPVWRLTGETFTYTPDTLYVPDLQAINPLRPRTRLLRRSGLALALGLSAASWYAHREAEAAYNRYLRSGKTSDLDRLFKQAVRADQISGITYLGAEFGLVLFTISFVIEP